MGITHHTTSMALRLRRDLVDLVRQLFPVTAGRADIIGLIRIGNLCHVGSPLKIKVHERAYTSVEIAGLAQLLAPHLTFAG